MNLGFVTVSNYFADEESENIAEVVTSWEYRQAAIIWYTSNVSQLDQKGLDEAAVHELSHILVAPMSDHLPAEHYRLEEFVVESIARAILNTKRGTK